ncbi:hypothetical protein ACFL23_04990, partial [Patescibacteria group bacterium]
MPEQQFKKDTDYNLTPEQAPVLDIEKEGGNKNIEEINEDKQEVAPVIGEVAIEEPNSEKEDKQQEKGVEISGRVEEMLKEVNG